VGYGVFIAIGWEAHAARIQDNLAVRQTYDARYMRMATQDQWSAHTRETGHDLWFGTQYCAGSCDPLEKIGEIVARCPMAAVDAPFLKDLDGLEQRQPAPMSIRQFGVSCAIRSSHSLGLSIQELTVMIPPDCDPVQFDETICCFCSSERSGNAISKIYDQIGPSSAEI